MTDICLMFEVHQPLRLKKKLGKPPTRRMHGKDLLDYYFDNDLNRMVLEKAAAKCYLPSNDILREQIDRFKASDRMFKVAFSISGVLLEQCEKWVPELIKSFKELVKTGCVELLNQTYYHSLASLFKKKTEFIDQLRIHRELMMDLFNQKPMFFENSEFLYNNELAQILENLGYKGMFTEGVDRVLGWRSPNYVYKPAGCKSMGLLTRNYRLSDDVGFRFSSRQWEEHPLTSDKYATWLANTPGQCINICMDYETFGEHFWPDTGIQEFLRHLPEEVLKHNHLRFSTPSEVIRDHEPVDSIDVPESEGAISWADAERDTSAWIGNTMQNQCFAVIEGLERRVKKSGDKDFLEVWRLLQTSDHLYYMYVGGGGPGVVHSYFSPMGSPIDAYVAMNRVLFDFIQRLYR